MRATDEGGAPGLFDHPLRVTRQQHRGLPTGLSYEQIELPPVAGVDSVATAVQLPVPPAAPDPDVTLAAAARVWCGEDRGQLVMRRASVAELERDGELVLAPDAINGVAPAVLAAKGCPLRTVGRDEPVRWVRAVLQDQHGWVPYLQAVTRGLEIHPDEPLTHPVNFAGLVAARGRSDAVNAGLADAIGQDALVLWWHGRAAVGRLRCPADLGGTPGLAVRCLLLSSPTKVPVVLAAVTDEVEGITTIAVAAVDQRGPTEGEPAIRAAVARASWQLVLSRALDAGGVAFAAGRPPGTLDHRCDRHYLEAAGPNLRRALDPLAALQLGLDPRVQDRLVRLIEAADALPEIEQITAPTATMEEQARAAGHALWVVDLTTPDVRAGGWHCVRVIVPDLLRVPVPAFPPDLSARLGQGVGGSANANALPLPGW
ncbi:YcaO-like family protein [Janibacter sp. GXQ6167]|uniref:YcaO-like family protein n=1 Tax=Janibacter sp. GXQ6167 TaxID=3240791 RepID=UPI0035240710